MGYSGRRPSRRFGSHAGELTRYLSPKIPARAFLGSICKVIGVWAKTGMDNLREFVDRCHLHSTKSTGQW